MRFGAVGIVAGLVLAGCGSAHGSGAAATPAKPPSVTMRVEHLHSAQPPYSAVIQVPTLSAAHANAAIRRINRAITGWVAAEVRSFTHQVEQNLASAKNLPASLPESNLHVTASVSLLTARVVSLRMQIEPYFTGEASPAQVTQGLTFDLATGHRYALSDLFRPHANYLPALATASTAGLRSFKPAGASCYVGGQPAAATSSFRSWWLSNKGLVVGFAAGYYTAAYCGPADVTIHTSAIRGLLRSGGPLGG